MPENAEEIGRHGDLHKPCGPHWVRIAARVVFVAMLASAGCFAPARGCRPLRGCGCELEHDDDVDDDDEGRGGWRGRGRGQEEEDDD